MTPMTDFLSPAILAFTGMVFLIWVLPGVIHRNDPAADDHRKTSPRQPRLKTHP